MEQHLPNLKTCPFCGSAPELRTSHGWHAVGCSTFMKCPASIHALTHRSEADAVRAWNTRTPGVLEPRKPDGYAYAYDSPFGGIRFNNGEPVNGSKPTRAIPYWLGAPPNGVPVAGKVVTVRQRGASTTEDIIDADGVKTGEGGQR